MTDQHLRSSFLDLVDGRGVPHPDHVGRECASCRQAAELRMVFEHEFDAAVAGMARQPLPSGIVTARPMSAVRRGLLPWVGAVGAVLLLVSVAVAVAAPELIPAELTSPAGSEPTPSPIPWTKGPIPESAYGPNGTIDMSQVPDFIPALDGDNVAGWVARSDLFPAGGDSPPEVITVLADDLVTVVGHMYPEVGFVPLGAEAELVPPADRDRDITILVRNESDATAILEITEAPDQLDRPRQPLVIAPEITLEAGEERAVRFQSPRDRWSLRLRGDLGFFFSDDLGEWARDPAFALVISEAGVLEIDRGR